MKIVLSCAITKTNRGSRRVAARTGSCVSDWLTATRVAATPVCCFGIARHPAPLEQGMDASIAIGGGTGSQELPNHLFEFRSPERSSSPKRAVGRTTIIAPLYLLTVSSHPSDR
jgi:hypothetical protein